MKVKKTLGSAIVQYLNTRVQFKDLQAIELLARLGQGFTDDLEDVHKKYGEEVKEV